MVANALNCKLDRYEIFVPDFGIHVEDLVDVRQVGSPRQRELYM